jgi:hypothetical protein
MTKIPTVKTGGGIFLMGDADAKENGPRFSLNSLAKLRCSTAESMLMFGRMSLLICQKQIEQKQPVRETLLSRFCSLGLSVWIFFSLIFRKDIRPRGIYIQNDRE